MKNKSSDHVRKVGKDKSAGRSPSPTRTPSKASVQSQITDHQLHATCISLKNKGILIIGKSGSGKSDLALRAVMQKNAKLIADDRTDIALKNNKIYASCPQPLQGLLEVRGLGIINISNTNYESRITNHEINLVIELVDKIQKIPRLPDEEFYEIKGIKIKKIKLYPFEPSSLDKLELSLSS